MTAQDKGLIIKDQLKGIFNLQIKNIDNSEVVQFRCRNLVPEKMGVLLEVIKPFGTLRSVISNGNMLLVSVRVN